MEKRELKKYLILGIIAMAVCIAVKYFSVIGQFFLIIVSAMYPMILGVAIAYIFDIFLSACEKIYFPKSKKEFVETTRRPVCLVMSIAFMIAIVALILKIIIPELASAVKILSQEIPSAVVELKNFAIEQLKDFPKIQETIYNMEFDWETVGSNLLGFVTSGAIGIISSITEIIGTVTMSVVNVVIAIIFAVYLLLRKEKLQNDLRRTKKAYLNERLDKTITKVYETANSTFRSFFIGQFAEAVILGLLCMIGMKILKLPYAAMTGTVVGVTALIPIVGAYLGAAVGAFVICTVDPMKTLIFIIFLILLQQFEGNVIYPKVVGTSVGLPSIWVLAAITVGGGLFGIMGMLLGVPVAATAYKLFHEKLRERELSLGINMPDNENKNGGQHEKSKRKRRYFKFKNIFRRSRK